MVGEAARTNERAGLPRLVALLLLPPVAWGLHTGVVYLLVTLDCVSDWSGSSVGVYVATAAFAGASAWAGFTGWRRWRSTGALSRDPKQPRPFVYVMTIAGSVLFTLAILLAGSTPLLLSPCVSDTLEPRLSAAAPPPAALRP